MKPLTMFRQRISFSLFIILGLFSSTLICRSGWTLRFADLKGFESYRFKPEYDYLHPVNAFALVRLPLLTNLYNYPNSEMGARYSDPKDKWNPTERLVQSIFNTIQGNDNPLFLQVSPLASKFGKYLGPSSISSIIAWMHKYKDRKRHLPVQVTVKMLEYIIDDSEMSN